MIHRSFDRWIDWLIDWLYEYFFRPDIPCVWRKDAGRSLRGGLYLSESHVAFYCASRTAKATEEQRKLLMENVAIVQVTKERSLSVFPDSVGLEIATGEKVLLISHCNFIKKWLGNNAERNYSRLLFYTFDLLEWNDRTSFDPSIEWCPISWCWGFLVAFENACFCKLRLWLWYTCSFLYFWLISFDNIIIIQPVFRWPVKLFIFAFLADWANHWLIDWPSEWFIDWLSEWLIDWLILLQYVFGQLFSRNAVYKSLCDLCGVLPSSRRSSMDPTALLGGGDAGFEDADDDDDDDNIDSAAVLQEAQRRAAASSPLCSSSSLSSSSTSSGGAFTANSPADLKRTLSVVREVSHDETVDSPHHRQNPTPQLSSFMAPASRSSSNVHYGQNYHGGGRRGDDLASIDESAGDMKGWVTELFDRHLMTLLRLVYVWPFFSIFLLSIMHLKRYRVVCSMACELCMYFSFLTASVFCWSRLCSPFIRSSHGRPKSGEPFFLNKWLWILNEFSRLIFSFQFSHKARDGEWGHRLREGATCICTAQSLIRGALSKPVAHSAVPSLVSLFGMPFFGSFFNQICVFLFSSRSAGSKLDQSLGEFRLASQSVIQVADQARAFLSAFVKPE